MTMTPPSLGDCQRRACAGAARRQHYDRSHSRRQDRSSGQSRRQVSDRARCEAGRTSTRMARGAAITK
jgi:hypothetical protein